MTTSTPTPILPTDGAINGPGYGGKLHIKQSVAGDQQKFGELLGDAVRDLADVEERVRIEVRRVLCRGGRGEHEAGEHSDDELQLQISLLGTIFGGI